MDLQLNGTRVLVTGGTRGIGRAIVEAFLDEGATVGFCARNAEEVAATQEALRDRGSVTGSVVDVGDADALASWVEESASAFGGLDVVVANVSALAIPDTEENWQASLNVDLMHTVRLVRGGDATPRAQRRLPRSSPSPASPGASRTSPPGRTARPRPRSSATSTGSPSSWPRRGSAPTPSRPATPTSRAVSGPASRAATPSCSTTAVGLNPTGHMGTPEEIAAPVVFLASPRRSRVSGTNLVVDGALTRGIQL